MNKWHFKMLEISLNKKFLVVLMIMVRVFVIWVIWIPWELIINLKRMLWNICLVISGCRLSQIYKSQGREITNNCHIDACFNLRISYFLFQLTNFTKLSGVPRTLWTTNLLWPLKNGEPRPRELAIRENPKTENNFQ